MAEDFDELDFDPKDTPFTDESKIKKPRKRTSKDKGKFDQGEIAIESRARGTRDPAIELEEKQERRKIKHMK